MTPVTPDVFTVEQAAKYLGIGPRVMRRLLPKIVHRKIDGRGTVRIHRQALDAYLLHEKGVTS